MNAIVIIFLFMYIIGIVAIVNKLRDVLENPDKYLEYNMEQLAEERIRNTPYCRFFKSLSHQYAFVPFFMAFVLTAFGGVIVYLTIRVVAWGNNLILPGTWLISVIALFFINLFFGMLIIPMHIKNSFFAVATDGMFGLTRYDNWRNGYIGLLVSFVLLFPFCGLSANNYIYYDENGITSSRYFELDETYTDYDDINEVRIYYYHNKKDSLYLKYELVLADGKNIDITTSDYYDENTLNIHKMLEKTGKCNVDVMPLTEDELIYLQDKLSKERYDLIIYIFEGFH